METHNGQAVSVEELNLLQTLAHARDSHIKTLRGMQRSSTFRERYYRFSAFWILVTALIGTACTHGWLKGFLLTASVWVVATAWYLAYTEGKWRAELQVGIQELKNALSTELSQIWN